MESRAIAFEGVENFRDCGGYHGAEGARVKPLRLLRSAHFAEASADDVARLERLGAALVVDLRRPEERASFPNRWPGATPRTVIEDTGQAQTLPPHLAVLLETDLTAARVMEYMRTAYAGYPFEARYRTLFRAVFQGLLEEDGAVVVHCAAGKDRTGVACALALTALGVARGDVMADYELTNSVVDAQRRLDLIRPRMEERLGRALDPEALIPMIGVRADYLDSAFAAIEAQGGMARYLEEAMGLGPAELARLRQRLLD